MLPLITTKYYFWFFLNRPCFPDSLQVSCQAPKAEPLRLLQQVCYSSDALPVSQPTALKHFRCQLYKCDFFTETNNQWWPLQFQQTVLFINVILTVNSLNVIRNVNIQKTSLLWRESIFFYVRDLNLSWMWTSVEKTPVSVLNSCFKMIKRIILNNKFKTPTLQMWFLYRNK